MTILELSNVAQGYYNSLRKKNLPSGWEKFVATDGKSCMFVKNDYEPEPGQAVFYLMTRNFQTLCQLHKQNQAEVEEQGSQYEVVALDDLMWKVTDTYHHISVTFWEGLFNQTQKVETPTKMSQDDMLALPKWLRELGDYVALNHADEALCKDGDARIEAINALGKEKFLITIAAALNGVWTDNSIEDGDPIAAMLSAEVEDYISDYQAPWLDEAEDKGALLGILEEFTDEEANEVMTFVRAFWNSNRDVNKWAHDLLWWPAWVPADK